MRLSRVVGAFVVLLVVAGVVLGILSGFFTQVGQFGSDLLGPRSQVSGGPGGQGADPSKLPDPADPSALRSGTPSSSASLPPSSTSSPTTPSPTTRTPTPGGSPDAGPGLPAPVLAVATEKVVADPAKVRARIAAAGPAPGRAGVEVVDGRGKVVYTANAKLPFIPASTNKLLTSAAALQLYGPEHRFQTKVVAGKGRQIVLVGGGDPYLVPTQPGADRPRRATLSGLATATATALKAQRRLKVSLGYDDSLFTGPAWNPKWPAGYGDQASPTSALWAQPKTPNATAAAVDQFARALRTHGIEVTPVGRVKAARSARQLATVSSMTVAQIVRQLLLVSDNNATEVMFRQVGLKAGGGGSITGGRRGVEATLSKLGVWTRGTVIYDGSGLARENGIPPNTFARLLQLASTDDHPRLRGLLTGLSVAGVEGSLRTRFAEPSMHPADGIVLGKTGTLTGVRSLAGYLRAPDGTMLYYSSVVNGAKDDYAAEIWLQRVILGLTACGCKR